MHPLSWISQESRPTWIYALLVLTAVVSAALVFAGRAIRRAGGPGIVSFELAEDRREVRRILTTWGPSGRRAARMSLLIDYAFLILYSALIALACLHLADRADAHQVGWVAVAGLVFAWAALAAGLLDAIENTALLRVLAASEPSEANIAVGRWAARSKFAIVSVCVLFLLIGNGLVALAPG